MKLHSILYPDACYGKSCVDGHFAVAWRHVKRYIEDTESDVVTPKDLMGELIYEGGVRNTVVDYIKMQCENITVCDYVNALEVRLMARIGSPADIVYVERPDGTLSITFFPYSKSYYIRYVINGHECMWDEQYVYRNSIDKEQLSDDELFYVDLHGKKKKRAVPGPFSATVKKNRTEKYRNLKHLSSVGSDGPGGEQPINSSRNEGLDGRQLCLWEERSGNVMSHDETQYETEWLEHVTRNEWCGERGDVTRNDVNEFHDNETGVRKETEEHEYGPSFNVGGVVNMTDEVNAQQRHAGKKAYHEMEPIMVCKATGVEVKYMGEIHHWRRNA